MKTLLTCCLIIVSTCQSFAQPCEEIVSYYPSWQWYDRDKLVNPQTIDYSKYSILNYAFLKPEPDGSISFFHNWADKNLLLGETD
jgi:GH18 family chitinase